MLFDPALELTKNFALARSCRGVNIDSYAKAVSQTFSSATDAFAHYVSAGSEASPELFPFIDPEYYATQLNQNLPSSTSAFEHYVTVGASQGLSPTPLFDPDYIKQQIGFMPTDLFHYLTDPAFSNIDPHPFFSKRYYYALYHDVVAAELDAFVHYLRHGWHENRSIHPFFRWEEYRRFGFPRNCNLSEFNRLLVSALESPVLSMNQSLFDASHYLQSLGAAEKIQLPLQHFVTSGWQLDASGFPLFDKDHFLAQSPDVRNGINPYIEYLSDFSHSSSPSKFFDPAFYLSSSSIDPRFMGSLLEHFIRIGLEQGARPHRMIAIMNACPSAYSGFQALQTFVDRFGRQAWLCSSTCGDILETQLDDINQIEPSLFRGLLKDCRLHPDTGAVDGHGQLLVAITIKIARCNCLVVSGAPLDDALVSCLLSASAFLVSNARPWLTLLTCSSPAVRYWHPLHGCESTMDTAITGDTAYKTSFVAQALLTGIPNKLVLQTDQFGVALLRTCGPQILATVPQVSLLLDAAGLAQNDERWLSEYLAANCAEYASLIVKGDAAERLGISEQLAQRANISPYISIQERQS